MRIIKQHSAGRPGVVVKHRRPCLAKRPKFTKLPRSGKPLPPFGIALEGADIFVLCGDGAWEAAREPRFAPRTKLLLPPGDSPFRYRWPVAGRDCWIVDRGANRETKLQVQGALMQAGADSVSYYEISDWFIS